MTKICSFTKPQRQTERFLPGFSPGFLTKHDKKTQPERFLSGFSPGFLIKRDKETQTECLQPPASSLGNIVSDPDLLAAIQGYLPKNSMSTLSLSSKRLWKEIGPILKESKRIKEILEIRLPDGYKQKLEGFNWTIGKTFEEATDKWKLTVNSVDEIVIESNIPCGSNYGLLFKSGSNYEPSFKNTDFLDIKYINLLLIDKEKPSTTCSTLKPQEKAHKQNVRMICLQMN